MPNGVEQNLVSFLKVFNVYDNLKMVFSQFFFCAGYRTSELVKQFKMAKMREKLKINRTKNKIGLVALRNQIRRCMQGRIVGGGGKNPNQLRK